MNLDELCNKREDMRQWLIDHFGVPAGFLDEMLELEDQIIITRIREESAQIDKRFRELLNTKLS
jgi:hypothetical protein